MLSLIVLFVGMYWEAAMDKIASPHHYKISIWKSLADYFDRKGMTHLGNNFWDGEVAWRNKWKNRNPEEGERFWGSSHIFVTVCDGWHVVKMLWMIHIFLAIVLYKPITPYFGLDMLLFFAAFAVGHHISFLYLQNQTWKKDIRKLFRNYFDGARSSGAIVSKGLSKPEEDESSE